MKRQLPVEPFILVSSRLMTYDFRRTPPVFSAGMRKIVTYAPATISRSGRRNSPRILISGERRIRSRYRTEREAYQTLVRLRGLGRRTRFRRRRFPPAAKPLQHRAHRIPSLAILHRI
jgi:hypothetical protein